MEIGMLKTGPSSPARGEENARKTQGLPGGQAATNREEEPSVKSFNASFGPGLIQGVNTLAAQTGVSPDAVLFAAWQVLLRRLTGQVAALAALLLPVDGSGGDGIGSAVSVQEISDEDDVEFIRYLKIAWDSNRTAFEALSHSGAPAPAASGNPQTLPPYFFSRGATPPAALKFKALLLCPGEGDSLRAELRYDADRMGGGEAEQMLSRYLLVLRGAVDNPRSTIETLNILAPGERDALLGEWSDGETVPVRDAQVHRLIEEQVARTPDAVALVFEESQLTYGEMNAGANRLARSLRELGVGPNVIVALAVNRSLGMATAMLAVLKSGGAYIPLDPTYPLDRLSYQLDDSRASILVTDSEEVAGIAPRGVHVLFPSREKTRSQAFAGEDLTPVGSDRDSALVMYTSGSTGKPKGVVISRHALSGMIQSVSVPLRVGTDDVYLHSASVTFILSVRQLYVPLMRGAAVVIASSATMRDPAALFILLARRRITVIDVVPSFWRVFTQWLASLPPDRQAQTLGGLKLRQITSVGEPLLGDVVRGWTAVFGTGTRLLNIYGQTETCGPVTCDVLPADPDERTPLVAIGRPIPGMRLYVLDRYMMPVPPGVPGEMYVAGPDLSDGYLNMPALSGEKFVKERIEGIPAPTLFRTGDIARFLPDRRIEYIGRSDFQIKIRGFRIEAGEVEALLNAKPAIRESVVVGRQDQFGQNRLIAYIVLREGATATVDDMRAHLSGKLPEYMVPSLFVSLESLPRMPNGKINRRGLPEPGPGSDLRQARPAQGEPAGVSPLGFYVPSWKRTVLPEHPRSGHGPKETLLVFSDGEGLGDALVRSLTSAGRDVMTVRGGHSFSVLGEREFIVDPLSQSDYEALFGRLSGDGRIPSKIVHLWHTGKALPASLPPEYCFHTILACVRALGGKINDASLELCVVTRGAHDVSGGEELIPERAMVLGPCRVIPVEYPNIACRNIDIEVESGPEAIAAGVEALMGEIDGEGKDPVAAYRGGSRWVEIIEPITPLEYVAERSLLREKGVYFLTGGYGGIGLVLAEKLARDVHARLVLVGRSEIPPEAAWDDWLRQHPQDDPSCVKIRKLQDILRAGGELILEKADVTDRAGLQRVAEVARARFGRINGVIHAAGISGGGTIRRQTRAAMDAVFSPKVAGTYVVESVFEKDNLDFLFLCSSLTSIQGRLGLAGYCAANAFIDLYARKRNRSGRPTIAVNWDTWDEVGMDAEWRAANRGVSRISEGGARERISPSDGADAFRRILSQRIPQVIVTLQNLAGGAGVDRHPAPGTVDHVRQASVGGGTPGAGSGSLFVAPRTEIEQTIARLWEKHLSAGPVGVRDNFFALGGNSLMAVQLFIDLEKELGKALPLATLFEAPTVEHLAAIFSDQRWTARWGSLVPIQPLGKNPPLFCAHGGGGNVLSFEALARHFGPEQPVYGLQSFGLDGSPPYTRVEDMAAHYLRDILEFQPDGPYYLEGMSFGGLVAFEMAQMLKARGKEVAMLALLDTYPKGYAKYGSRETIWRKLELRLSEFLALSRKDKSIFLRHRREEYGRRLSSLLRRALPSLVTAEESQITRAVRTVWEANLIASARYEPRPYDGRVSIFWARESYVRSTHRFRLGWSLLAPDKLEFRLVPGTHITMFEEPNVQVLVREMNECIKRGESREPSGTTRAPEDLTMSGMTP